MARKFCRNCQRATSVSGAWGGCIGGLIHTVLVVCTLGVWILILLVWEMIFDPQAKCSQCGCQYD